MSDIPIVIASDHAGFELKEILKSELEAIGMATEDLGVHDTNAVDYPDMANALAAVVSENANRRGLLLCGTGIGASIAANRHRRVRAALCHSAETARMARQHNDANVLVLGSGGLGDALAQEVLCTFLATPDGAARHGRRVDKILSMDR